MERCERPRNSHISNCMPPGEYRRNISHLTYVMFEDGDLYGPISHDLSDGLCTDLTVWVIGSRRDSDAEYAQSA
jgi:hypothetical protein